MVHDVSPSALHGRLPHFTSASAQLSRVLADARSAHPGVAYGLRTHGLGPTTFECAITLDLGCAHGAFSVTVEAQDSPVLHSMALDTEPRRAAALANMWLSDLLACLSTEAGGTPSVRAISLAQPVTVVDGLPLHFAFDGIDRRCVVRDLPLALADEYARAWTQPRLAYRANVVDDIVAPGIVRLRSRRCSPALLGSLARHDVLVGWQPSAPFGANRPLQHASLRFGAARGRQLCAGVRVDAHSVTLETPVTPVHDAQSDDFSPYGNASGDASATLPNEPLVDVAAMDLPVHIELLTVNLSIAQLSALQPGYVVDLPLPLEDAAVRLVAYGQTLALGKLVAVGDNLGVQIERMAASDERQS